jgi:pSer/pThr/pTyr-binding forkhead associated (FHA) protein
MKPIKAPAETASDSRSSAPASFLDSLKAIDVSSLDRLIAIRQEHTRIDEYRTKAEGKKREVAEAVYKRVVEDYARRAAALEQQSAPLRAQARAEYRKLKALIDALGRTHEQAQLQKDELQFRHAVGELNDIELADKLDDPQRVLDQCAAGGNELDASKARFIEALGSEEALEAPEPAAATAPAHEPPAKQAAAPAPQPETAARQTAAPPMLDRKPAAVAQKTADASRPLPPSPEPPAAVAPPDDDGATRGAGSMADVSTRAGAASARPADTAAPTRAPGPSPVRPVPRPAPEAEEGATVMLASAAIVIDDPAGPKEYPLSVVNGIGRSDENRICLSNAGISRKHAVITALARGFTIKDLGSQNGTFINGQRVTETQLADGDTIDVGSVRFVFRTPWKAAAGDGAARSASTTPGKR